MKKMGVHGVQYESDILHDVGRISVDIRCAAILLTNVTDAAIRGNISM